MAVEYFNGKQYVDAAVPHYKLGEVPTGGTWVDGKPIYRSVIDCGNATSVTISVSSLNIDTLIRLDGFGTDNSNGSGSKWTFDCSSGNNSRNFFIDSSGNLRCQGSYYKKYAILEYTKTTD